MDSSTWYRHRLVTVIQCLATSKQTCYFNKKKKIVSKQQQIPLNHADCYILEKEMCSHGNYELNSYFSSCFCWKSSWGWCMPRVNPSRKQSVTAAQKVICLCIPHGFLLTKLIVTKFFKLHEIVKNCLTYSNHNHFEWVHSCKELHSTTLLALFQSGWLSAPPLQESQAS